MTDEQNKEKLKTMLDNTIADKSEDAEIAFHQYLQDKMQAKIKGEQASESDKD